MATYKTSYKTPFDEPTDVFSGVSVDSASGNNALVRRFVADYDELRGLAMAEKARLDYLIQEIEHQYENEMEEGYEIKEEKLNADRRYIDFSALSEMLRQLIDRHYLLELLSQNGNQRQDFYQLIKDVNHQLKTIEGPFRLNEDLKQLFANRLASFFINYGEYRQPPSFRDKIFTLP